MTAALPESQGTGGVSSLEVRWIFPGDVADAVAGWFARPALPMCCAANSMLPPHWCSPWPAWWAGTACG